MRRMNVVVRTFCQKRITSTITLQTASTTPMVAEGRSKAPWVVDSLGGSSCWGNDGRPDAAHATRRVHADGSDGMSKVCSCPRDRHFRAVGRWTREVLSLVLRLAGGKLLSVGGEAFRLVSS